MADRSYVAVTDTSPLIGLCAIGRLDLLEAMFARLIIPDEVWGELTFVPGAPEPGPVLRLSNVSFAAPRHRPPPGLERLGLGERETIRGALEHQPALVLRDDYEGRLDARRRGLDVRGILGLLVHGKGRGLVAEVRPLVVALRSAHFRLGVQVANRALAAVGEPGL